MRRGRTPLAAPLLLLGSLAVALPDDSSQPINIETNEAIRDETSGETIYRGDVRLRQGSLEIRADEITLKERDGGGRDEDSLDPLAGSRVFRIIARGTPATMQQQLTVDGEPVRARAGVIEYLQPRALVLMRNAAAVRQGRMELRAARIEYLIDAQEIHAFGNPQSGRRVSSSIPPERLREDS